MMKNKIVICHLYRNFGLYIDTWVDIDSDIKPGAPFSIMV